MFKIIRIFMYSNSKNTFKPLSILEITHVPAVEVRETTKFRRFECYKFRGHVDTSTDATVGGGQL